MAKRTKQKDKQRYTNITNEIKDRVTRIPLKTGGDLRCSERVISTCSTSGTRRVNLCTNPYVQRYTRHYKRLIKYNIMAPNTRFEAQLVSMNEKL
jgi:hypothetical protein